MTAINEIMSNAANYSEISEVDIFESIDTAESWASNADDATLTKCIDAFRGAEPTECGRLLAVSVTLKLQRDATHKYQSSFSKWAVTALLNRAGLHPGFLPSLMGRSDYWAPTLVETSGAEGSTSSIHFWCQHPRWRLNDNPAPCSIYMRFDKAARKILYIITSGDLDTIARSMREDFEQLNPMNTQRLRPVDDPLRLHVRVAFLSFEQSKDPLLATRLLLYEQLEEVDRYKDDSSLRPQMTGMTKQLHLVSQNTDSLMGSTEMGIAVAEKMMEFWEMESQMKAGGGCCCSANKSTIPPLPSYDALRYIIWSLHRTNCWLLTYKARKDTAMNLVFNLVTQMDSAINQEISRDMKRDSSSMNAIVILTISFLPCTAVATLFGGGIFNDGVKKDLLVAYIVASILLTLAVILSWRYGSRSLAAIVRFRSHALPSEDAKGRCRQNNDIEAGGQRGRDCGSHEGKVDDSRYEKTPSTSMLKPFRDRTMMTRFRGAVSKQD